MFEIELPCFEYFSVLRRRGRAAVPCLGLFDFQIHAQPALGREILRAADRFPNLSGLDSFSECFGGVHALQLGERERISQGTRINRTKFMIHIPPEFTIFHDSYSSMQNTRALAFAKALESKIQVEIRPTPAACRCGFRHPQRIHWSDPMERCPEW